MSKKIPSRIRELAKLPPGPVIKLEIECSACGYEWIAATVKHPLYFRCPSCGKRKGERKDDGSSAVIGTITGAFDN
jgi:hypothetical protein